MGFRACDSPADAGRLRREAGRRRMALVCGSCRRVVLRAAPPLLATQARRTGLDDPDGRPWYADLMASTVAREEGRARLYGLDCPGRTATSGRRRCRAAWTVSADDVDTAVMAADMLGRRAVVLGLDVG